MSKTKVIIPNGNFKVLGQNLVIDAESGKFIQKLLTSQDISPSLTIQNKRKWIKVNADILALLNSPEMTINFPKVENVELRLFDYYTYPIFKSATIPSEKLTLNVSGKMHLSQPSNQKANLTYNNSPLKELTLSAAAYDTRLCFWPNLEKITYSYNSSLQNPQKDKAEDWWNRNTFILRQNPKLKEIDLSELKYVGSYIYFDFDRLPLDCKIKINPKLFSRIKKIQLSTLNKNRICFSLQEMRSDYWASSIYLPIPLPESVLNSQEPIEITFKQLLDYVAKTKNEIISKQAKQPKPKEPNSSMGQIRN